MAQGVNVDFNATGLARFTNVVDKITSDLSKFQTNAERVNSNLTKIFAGLGAGLSADYFVGMIKGSIDAADQLKDLSKSTSLTVVELAGLKLAAMQAGGDLDSIAAAINKLSVNMGKDGEKFASIGIKAKEPIEAFKELSDLFISIKDPQQRAAIAAEALGKSWQGAAPLLAEGSKRITEMIEKGSRLSGITEEMTDAADDFNDKWAELTQTGGLLTKQVGSLLPLLNALADDMILVQNETDGTAGSFHPLAEAFRAAIVLGGNVSFVLKGVGTEIGGMAAQLNALAHLNFSAFSSIGEAMKEDAEKARKAFDAWEDKMMAVGTPGAKVAAKDGSTKPGKPPPKSAIDSFIGKSSRTSGESKAHDFDKEISAEYKRAKAATQRAADAAARAAEQEADAMQRLREKYLNVIDPLKKYQDELIEIEQLRLKGTLSADEAADAVKQVSAAMEKAKGGLDEIADTGDDAFKKLTSAVEGWGRQFTDTLADMAMGGKATFTDLADSIIRDLIRIQIQKNITDPLVKAGTSILDGAFKSGGSGLMASLTDFFIPKFSFASGTDYVPRDMIAQIHQGERIVPADQNRPGGADAGITIHQTLNAHGADAGTLQQIRALMAAQREELVRMVPALVSRQQLRNRITPMGM